MVNSKFIITVLVASLPWLQSGAQDFSEQYEAFKKSASESYSAFRDSVNSDYAEFLNHAWEWYEGEAPLPVPEEKNPIPPRPYIERAQAPVEIVPEPLKSPEDPDSQPIPFTPIKEKTEVVPPSAISFYGISPEIRIPETARRNIIGIQEADISDAWKRLANGSLDNTIRDCLSVRIAHNLSDWAYLKFLNSLGKSFCLDDNSATMLTAFLFCQSGYKMRLGIDGNKLLLLYGSKHYVYDTPYYFVDGTQYYPLESTSGNIKISNASFFRETPMSLNINSEQLLGTELSDDRSIKSKRFSEVEAVSKVPVELIKFYNDYPSSAVGNNPLTRWAMYANTPLAEKTKEVLYPSLKKSIENCSKLEAANKLLNWVQTGFVYEYDNKVWGHDRAFFAEETLYYPYADCEDRSILFSRLVRDLLGLDVALIYYPGHLATAVKFDTDVRGDAMIINGEKFIVCDPTYIGAPVGSQMPGLAYDKTEAIILK